MRIPITMCHGISEGGDKPLTADHLDRLMGIAAELGFQSVSYDDLAAWRDGACDLPGHPIMLDFDHPARSMRHGVMDVLARYGYCGNLFINTAPLEQMYAAPLPPDDQRGTMTWEEIGELMAAGWLIGAHTHSHPNLSALSVEDPTGGKLREELEKNDEMLQANLGVTPRDFAFTGTSWSSAAEREVAKRYRFGRLWIVGSTYNADGQETRYADLVGVPGPDEADGGPPAAARYITGDTDPYRLPSMELQALIHSPEAFRAYLEGAEEG